MKTPKRVLLLLGTLLLFVIFFGIYAYFLGGIDGFGPLPVSFHPHKGQPLPDGWPPPSVPPVNIKLHRAFGADCPEVDYNIKVEVSKKGLAFATNQFKILEDGRVRFEPFSLALFNKKRRAGDFPEINTVRSEEAFLTFDRPIKNMREFGERKIIGAELRGKITINNNRKTPENHDDIRVHIVNGPLLFSDPKKKIWSDGIVRLIDSQPQLDPTQITAKGVEIYLDKNTPLTGRDSATEKKRTGKSISAVERIVLKSNVDMHLYIDSDSGFLAGDVKQNEKQPVKSDKKQQVAAKEKSHIHIKTQGPVAYDLTKETAVFESPPHVKKELWNPDDQVSVVRVHKKGRAEIPDQLVCHRLELQFRRKENSQSKHSRTDQASSREIASARATARPGKSADNRVTLTLSSENLEAYGKVMVYNSANKSRGAETIVTGSADFPMWAVKDAHKIIAIELRLVAPKTEGGDYFAFAKGPGQIDLMDPSKKSSGHLYHAAFKESMTVTKVREGEKRLDLLTFAGQAAFIDDAGKQDLRADKLQIWLEPADRTRSDDQLRKAKKFKAGSAPRQQPHRLEGFGNVRIYSPKLRVKKCEHLLVHFQDEGMSQLPAAPSSVGDGDSQSNSGHTVLRPNQPAGPELPPANAPENDPTPKHLPTPPSAHNSIVPVASNTTGEAATRDPLGSAKLETSKPIDLRARDVSVVVIRRGKNHELRKVRTIGNVHVYQDGKSPKDKGVVITGEALDLVHHPADGNVLIVLGDKETPARLQLGNLILVGPEVTIDQQKNTAAIKGVGAMSLPSNTTFEGGKPEQTDTRLTVHWTEEMFFNGKDASFYGGVVAYQNEASLRCKTMRVSLDRKVSLREGEKNGKGAKVERLVCTNQIDIMESKKDAQGRIARFDRLIASELTVDNRYGPINAAGPGRVYLWQPGTMSITGKPRNTDQKRYYLTRVDFTGRLYSTKHPDKSRIAKFYDNVEVIHLPANHPNVKIDRTKLPPNSLYMSCQELILHSRPIRKAESTHVMIAQKMVRFWTDKFYGNAAKVTYDQNSDVIIFEGGRAGGARLYKLRPGQRPEYVTGNKILYNRRTGGISIDRTTVIEGGG